MYDIQGTSLVDSFPRDTFSSPYIDISDDYLIIEFDISPSETQVFLYRQSDRLLFWRIDYGSPHKLFLLILPYSSFHLAR